jgi:hypothetical protein
MEDEIQEEACWEKWKQDGKCMVLGRIREKKELEDPSAQPWHY